MDPKGLVVNSTHVFWFEWKEGGGSILGALKSGGPPQMIISQLDQSSFTVDDQHLYWVATGNEVQRAPLSDLSKIEKIHEFVAVPGTFLLQDEGLYYTNNHIDGAILFWKQGVGVKYLGPAMSFSMMAGDEQYIYFGHKNVGRLRKDGTKPPEIIDKTTTLTWGVASDATHLYWSLYSKEVRRATKGGGPIETLLPKAAYRQFALTDKTLYVTVDKLFDAPRGVLRLPKAGGPIEWLQCEASAWMAADKNHVYWTTPGGVFRVPL